MIGTIIKIKDTDVIGIVAEKAEVNPCGEQIYIILGLNNNNRRYTMRLSNPYVEVICK